MNLSLLKGIASIRLIDFLRGTSIYSNLKTLRIDQFKSYDYLQKISKNKFDRHLSYASENSIYYKQLFSQNIQQVLTKDLIRNNFNQLKSAAFNGKVFSKSTGGSTGNPLVYLTTQQAQSFMWAAIFLSWETAGYTIGDRVAFIAGTSLHKSDYRHKYFYKLLNVQIYSAYNLEDENIKIYLDSIAKKRIKLIYAYASVLDRIADYLLKYNIQPVNSVLAIVSTAEVLTPEIRNKIELAFGLRVFNQYGCNEAGISAFECEHGKMHLINSGSWAYTDYQDNLIATNLVNEAFIFINYFSGDKVKFSKSKECRCNRGYPIISEIIGRTFDFVRDTTGKVLNGAFFSILFRSDASIERYQIQYDLSIIKVLLKINTDSYHADAYCKYVSVLQKYLKFDHYEILINEPFLTIPNGKHLQVIDLTKRTHEYLV
jgi:phenylacetate-CoA ligase